MSGASQQTPPFARAFRGCLAVWYNFTMKLPLWVRMTAKLISSSVRHPRTPQVMIVKDDKVEVKSALPPIRDEHDPEIDLG